MKYEIKFEKNYRFRDFSGFWVIPCCDSEEFERYKYFTWYPKSTKMYKYLIKKVRLNDIISVNMIINDTDQKITYIIDDIYIDYKKVEERRIALNELF